ncbi:MAG TPA: hypothetical protein ENH34_05775 [Phycisphaerales bacterium]|nr:hypothetical protein [Phycisphaerales bacterium]
MVKRISCKVVNSVPLAKRGGERRKAYRPNSEDRRNSNLAVKNVNIKKADPSLTYTDRLNIAGVSIDSSQTGRILDCCV